MTNDLGTTFPKVTLFKGRSTRLSEATVVAEFTGVRAGTRHTVALTCAPVLVRAAEKFYLAVSWPASDGVRGVRDGAGIPAVVRPGGAHCYVASSREKELQRIEGVDLGLRLVMQGGVAKSEGEDGHAPVEAKQWRTFFNAAAAASRRSDGVMFSFGVDRQGPVSITIYDVGGRAVKTLMQESLEPGEYTRRWDGRNSSGATVAAGVYVAKLAAGDRALKQKVIMTR